MNISMEKCLARVVDLAGMHGRHIHHRGVRAVGAEVAFDTRAIHEKAAALAGAGVGLGRAICERDLRARQRKVSARRDYLPVDAPRTRGHQRQ